MLGDKIFRSQNQPNNFSGGILMTKQRGRLPWFDCRRPSFHITAALVSATLLVGAELHAVCIGDCNGDGEVRINELIQGVNIALGRATIDSCPEFDRNNDGRVAIGELVAAVNNALSGCPPETPTATPTPDAGTPTPDTGTPTNTPTGQRVNASPEISVSPPGDKVAQVGQTLIFTISSSDPDCPSPTDDCDPSDATSDRLTRMAAPLPLPPNATYNATTGQFRFAPTVTQAGLDITLTFTANDSDLRASVQVRLTVPPPPGATSFQGQVLTVPSGGSLADAVGLGGVRLVLGVQAPLETVSGNDGSFIFNNIPFAGAARLLIDGSTANGAGAFATVPESVRIIKDAANVLDAPIFLLPLDIASADRVDPANESTITSSPVVIEGREFPAVALTVPAETAMDDATGEMFDGLISITRIPDPVLGPRPLPDEIELSIYIAVQPFGVRYTVPVPISFPNVEGFPIGTIVDIFGLNHNTGVFEKVGDGRVESDGMVHSGRLGANGVFTRGGVVRENSWHGFVPQPVSRKDDPSSEDGGCKFTTQVGWPPDRCTMCMRDAQGLSIPVTLPESMSSTFENPHGLSYNLAHAQPEIYASIFASPGNLAPPPRETGTKLSIGGLAVEGEVLRDVQCSQFNCAEARYSHSADASDLSTGIYDLSMELFCRFQISSRNEFFEQRNVVINEQNSHYGAGVSWQGLYRIHQANNGRLLVTDGGVSGQVYTRATCADIDLTLGETEIYRFFVDADDVEVTLLPKDPSLIPLLEVLRVPDNLVFASGNLDTSDGSVKASFPAPTSGIFALRVSSAAASSGAATLCVSGIDDRVIARDVASSANRVTVLRNGSIDTIGTTADVSFFANAGDEVTIEVLAPGESQLRPGFRVLNSDGAAVGGGSNPAKAIVTLPATDTYTLEVFGAGSSTGDFSAEITFAGDVTIRFADDTASFSARLLAPTSSFDELREIFAGDTLTGYEIHHADGGRVIFNALGYQTSYFDLYGNQRRYIWDGDLLEEIIDFDGRSTLIAHVGLEIRITDKAGRLTTLVTDTRNRLVRILGPAGITTIFRYEDPEHPYMITGKTSPGGRSTTFADNGDGSFTISGGDGLASMTVQPDQGVGAASEDGSTTPAIREADLRATISDGLGRSERLQIDRDGNATEIFDRLNIRRTAAYFRGLPILKTLPNNAPISFDWDDRGRLVRRTFNELNASLELSYDGDNLVEVRDEEGNVVEFQYDERNFLTRAIYPDHVTAFFYDESDSPILGKATRIVYNFGQANQATAIYIYDGLGQLSAYICPLGNRYDFEYNAFGYIVSVRLFGVVVWTIEYNLLGYITGFIDITLRKTIIERDSDGFILSISNALEQFLESYVYDDCGRLQLMTYADGIQELFEYNENNNIIRITIGEEVIEFGYDFLDRIETVTISGVVILSIDWDLLGYASVVVHDASRIEYFRDRYGRLLSERIRGECQPNIDVTYNWDLIGRLQSRRDAAGTTTYSYLGHRLDTVQTAFGDSIDFDYTPNRLALNSDSGFRRTVDYDNNHRVTSVENRVTASAPFPGLVSQFSRTFDDDGNVDQLSADRTVGLPTLAYSYDDLNQLTLAGAPLAGRSDETFTYDAVGNRKRKTGDTTDAEHNERNEILSTSDYTFEHDDRGRITRKTRRSDNADTRYEFDGFDNLIQATLFDGTVIEYAYDGYGRRIKKSLNGNVISSHVYSGRSVINGFDASNALTSAYTYGLGGYDPVVHSAITGSDERHFYLAKDPQCSITELVDLAGASASATTSTAIPDSIVGTTVYEAFGGIAESTGIESKPAYRSLPLDRTTGLYQLYSGRDYDPDLGRTLQPSRLRARQDDPLTLNPYLFARNNPTSAAFVEGALPGESRLHTGAGHFFARPGPFSGSHRSSNVLFDRLADARTFFDNGPRADLASVLVQKLRGTAKCYAQEHHAPPLILDPREELVSYYVRHARRAIDQW